MDKPEEIKRDYSKFFTPTEIADYMVDILDPQPKEWILEPSAGNGAIVKRIKAKCSDCRVTAVELDGKWESQLKQFAEVVVMKDFLTIPVAKFISKWDKCIANPPFGNETDLMAHYLKIRECVKENGKIVMIVPDDFIPDILHLSQHINNWSSNSDGTTTKIKIIEFYNQPLNSK